MLYSNGHVHRRGGLLSHGRIATKPTNERPTDASAIHEIGHQKIVPKSLKFATLSIKRIYNIITSHHHEQSKPNYQELNPHIQQFRASIDN